MKNVEAWLCATAGCIVACIIPDREIIIEQGETNAGAVRIVERTILDPQMAELCAAEPRTAVNLEFCQQVRSPLRFDPDLPRRPRSLPSGLLRPNDGDFCSCPGRDLNAIESFAIYAEDADFDGDASRDTLYGVALLDPDPFSEEPHKARAYANYWTPCAAGVEVTVASDDELVNPSTGRQERANYMFSLDDGSTRNTVDLCNDVDGDTLEPGLHNLQFMVTDRPFFSPSLNGVAGTGPVQCGVPDLAQGATYAVINYVFECRDPADAEDPDNPSECNCAQVDL